MNMVHALVEFIRGMKGNKHNKFILLNHGKTVKKTNKENNGEVLPRQVEKCLFGFRHLR